MIVTEQWGQQNRHICMLRPSPSKSLKNLGLIIQIYFTSLWIFHFVFSWFVIFNVECIFHILMFVSNLLYCRFEVSFIDDFSIKWFPVIHTGVLVLLDMSSPYSQIWNRYNKRHHGFMAIEIYSQAIHKFEFVMTFEISLSISEF